MMEELGHRERLSHGVWNIPGKQMQDRNKIPSSENKDMADFCCVLAAQHVEKSLFECKRSRN